MPLTGKLRVIGLCRGGLGGFQTRIGLHTQHIGMQAQAAHGGIQCLGIGNVHVQPQPRSG